jgi:hypothetical protein
MLVIHYIMVAIGAAGAGAGAAAIFVPAGPWHTALAATAAGSAAVAAYLGLKSPQAIGGQS